ncbi:unnamed protein product [Dicrocoelium dendriticum]|nr:unnamed protein product [Dicrocoelium dendriticum]
MPVRPTRSSLKSAPVSAIDESITDRQTRRVSFAPVISVCGMEDKILPGSFSGDGAENAQSCDITLEYENASVGDTSDMSLSDYPLSEPGKPLGVLPMANETWELSVSSLLCDTPKNVSILDVSDMIQDSSPPTSVQGSFDSPASRSPYAIEHQGISPHLAESPKQPMSEGSSISVASVTPTNYPALDSSSERKLPNHSCLPDHRVSSSLPPLRRHQSMLTAGLLIPKSDYSVISDGKSHSGSRGTKGTFNTTGQLLSQSLANTPLRQISPTIAAHNDQQSNPLSIFNNGGRRDPSRFLPSVDRLHSHVLRLSARDLNLQLPSFGVAPSSLRDFLDRHPCDPAVPSQCSLFPNNLNDLKHLQPHLYEEFLELRSAVERSCTERISQYTEMAHCRRSGVLLDHSKSLPVVKQLRNMSSDELTTFLAEAHEKLYVAELCARHALCELKNAGLEEYQAEQKYELDRIEELLRRLDRDELLLQRTAAQLDSDFRAYQLVESSWTDCKKRSETLAEETKTLGNALRDVLAEGERLTSCLREFPKHNSDPTCAGLSPVDRTVGASVLFPSPVAHSLRNRPTMDSGNADPSQDGTANLLLPCTIDCLSFEEQKYSLRTLFGLIAFHVVCNSVQSIIQGKQKSSFISLENLIVAEVECCAPPSHLLPAECEPVQAFADHTISFFNSRDGRSRLRALLIGVQLSKVIKLVEFFMSPYLVLAADLRAMFWAGSEVRFSASSNTDLPSQKVLHRSLSKSTLNEPSQCRSFAGLDSLPSDRIIPTGPISITVTVFSPDVYSVVCLQFIFPSIEVDVAVDTVTSATVLFGPIDSEQVRTFLDARKPFPGGMYRTVCELLNLLPLWKN